MRLLIIINNICRHSCVTDFINGWYIWWPIPGCVLLLPTLLAESIWVYSQSMCVLQNILRGDDECNSGQVGPKTSTNTLTRPIFTRHGQTKIRPGILGILVMLWEFPKYKKNISRMVRRRKKQKSFFVLPSSDGFPIPVSMDGSMVWATTTMTSCSVVVYMGE